MLISLVNNFASSNVGGHNILSATIPNLKIAYPNLQGIAML